MVPTRVLIIEDEAMIAFALESLLEDFGFEISGVADELDGALSLIARRDFDIAILDARLAGVSAAPAATALKAVGRPFVTVSGYAADQLGDAFNGAPSVRKPWRIEHVVETLRAMVLAASRCGGVVTQAVAAL